MEEERKGHVKEHGIQDSASWNLPMDFYCFSKCEKAGSSKLKSWFFWKLSPIKICVWVCVYRTNLGCILWYSFPLEAIFSFWTPQIFEGESRFNTLLLISHQKLLSAFVHNFLNQMLSVEWGEVHPGVMPLPPWSSYISNLAPRN